MNTTDIHSAIERAYRTEARRVLATLIRLLGGFDAAEEAVHEAFAAAAEQWPREGVPSNPYAWLVSTGRFKWIDRWRREDRLRQLLPELALLADETAQPSLTEGIEDDELRLIFACCHPSIAPDAQIALTLREVGGLTTEEVARAFQTPAPTIAQRIVRAKAKLRDEAVPFDIPERADLPKRIDNALHVLYLIFNEGYAATTGAVLIRDDLCQEAIRLGRLVVGLLDDPEAQALLALMLLHAARQSTRLDDAGDLILLENQDRSRWDRQQILEAQGLIERALAARRVGPYLLQAAIAAVHAEAPSTEATDWPQIISLYDTLLRVSPSPVIALNRAVAMGMRDGPDVGLQSVEAVLKKGGLDDYHYTHSARGEMQRRLGLLPAAAASYERALELARQPAERRFLQTRLAQVTRDGAIATPVG